MSKPTYRELEQKVKQLEEIEAKLRESEEKFRLAFQTNPDSINLNRAADGLYLDVNEGFTRLTGYTRAEVIGKTSLELNIWVNPEDRERLIHELMTVGYVEDLKAQFRRKNGQVGIGLMSARLLRINQENVILSITRDITREVALEEQFRQAQKLEAIGRLAGGIAHDFNNLLVPIMGYTDLAMLQLSPADKLYPMLEQIGKAAGRAADLTRQILAFSRRQVLELQPLNLNEVIRDFQPMAQRLLREDIDLDICLSPALDYIQADRAQIDQILMNLVINAGEAMPTGGHLTIETANIFLDELYFEKYADDKKPGHYVMLAVSDTGLGMDAETRKHIFEPFFTTKAHGQGTGLGLATTFGIVKQHQGHICVYSEPGHGTTFKVYLPRSNETAQPRAITQAGPIAVGGVETVLVVEDEEMVRQLVCETLTAHGYNVIEAGSPERALELAMNRRHNIHLLLTDVIMPGMNGRELQQKLIALNPNIKVLFMSGYTDNVIVRHGILDRNVNFLQKPFTVTSLTQKVRHVLNQ